MSLLTDTSIKRTLTVSPWLSILPLFVSLYDGHLSEKETNSTSAGPYAFRVAWFERVFPTVRLGYLTGMHGLREGLERRR